jgi:hypothetical protein
LSKKNNHLITLKAPNTLLLALFCWSACQQPTQSTKTAIPAFYTWKTRFTPGEWENNTLQTWGAQRLYVKYADIDWREGRGAVPVSSTQLDWAGLDSSIQIVPVFFIVHRVFEQLSAEASHTLAQRLLERVRTQSPVGKALPEIQIDCDWTNSTRDAYFRFLEYLRAEIILILGENTRLSATIRLHQVKYREKTGVPPVDQGLLMLYNFDRPSNATVKNSILDIETANSYLKNTPPYPLPLDVALPLFAWGLHFRGNDFQGFLHDFRNKDATKADFLTRIEQNIYRVNKDTSCLDAYFRPGDWIRLESAEPAALAKVWQLAQGLMSNNRCYLVFFDLNTQNIPFYTHEDLYQRLQMAH